jgi:hypothetical protein
VCESKQLVQCAYGDRLTFSEKWQTIRSHFEGMIIFVWRWQLLASILGIVTFHASVRPNHLPLTRR